MRAIRVRSESSRCILVGLLVRTRQAIQSRSSKPIRASLVHLFNTNIAPEVGPVRSFVRQIELNPIAVRLDEQARPRRPRARSVQTNLGAFAGRQSLGFVSPSSLPVWPALSHTTGIALSIALPANDLNTFNAIGC
jgi:hypothetical protein